MGKGKPVTLEGKTFKSIKEAAEYYNLNSNKVRNRLNSGWSIEEAFELVERKTDPIKGKQIILDGKTFVSIVEAARYYNLNSKSIRSRLRKGWSLEEAFEIVERKNERFREITIEGKTFKSIKEACKHYNLNYSTIRNRLDNLHLSLEEAFNINQPDINIGLQYKEITIEGKTFKSVKEACKYYDLEKEYHTIIYRLNSGWSVEDAFGLYIEMNYKNGRSIVIDGNSFISIKEACDYYDLDYEKVRHRISNYGWSIEEAFELKQRDKSNKPITVEGKTFKSIKEACEFYNLSDITTIYSRLNNGWSIEEAFELKLRSKSNKPITIEGKTFKSIRQACKYYNLNYKKVIHRLHNYGWTIEEAFELVPRQKR